MIEKRLILLLKEGKIKNLTNHIKMGIINEEQAERIYAAVSKNE